MWNEILDVMQLLEPGTNLDKPRKLRFWLAAIFFLDKPR